MTARLEFTDAMRRIQAEATGLAMAKGTARILGESGELLAECAVAAACSVGAKGERLAFAPLGDARVVAKGRPVSVEFVSADGQVLGKGLAGEHQGAVVRFRDARLYEGMTVVFDEPFVLELGPPA